jgi:hypothetical protein
MHKMQGSKTTGWKPLHLRTKEVSAVRDLHEMGWPVVSVLRFQAEDKAEKFKTQAEIQGQVDGCPCSIGWNNAVCSFLPPF